MTKQPATNNSFTTTISLDPELYAEFRQIAEQRHNRTPRQQVRQLISDYVEREREKAPA